MLLVACHYVSNVHPMHKQVSHVLGDPYHYSAYLQCIQPLQNELTFKKNKVFNLTIYTGHPDRWCPLFLLQDSLMPGSKRCICTKDVETRTMTIWGRQWHVEPLPPMLKVMCGHRLIISGCVLVWCSESIESEKQILHYETPVKKND